MIRVKRGHIDAFDSPAQVGLGFNLHASKKLEDFDTSIPISPVKRSKIEKDDKSPSIKPTSAFPKRKSSIKGI